MVSFTSENEKIGSIPGVAIGQIFANRKSLARTGVHRPLMAGISGNSRTGAESIVLSGGYEDDEDRGDLIVYTGQGGNDLYTRRQIADQTLTRGNAALKKSCDAGQPVRVIRGWRSESKFAPASGYRYDGLFRVEDYISKTGLSGFKIWQFILVKDGGESASPNSDDLNKPGLPSRVEVTTQRIVRNTRIARRVKELYSDACQICGHVVPTKGGGKYSEGAHVQPLGIPHNGPDTEANVLCLCPNHHVQLDLGGLVIGSDNFVRNSVTGEVIGRLTRHPEHRLDSAYLNYRKGMKDGS